jgi:hypothetical protein
MRVTSIPTGLASLPTAYTGVVTTLYWGIPISVEIIEII